MKLKRISKFWLAGLIAAGLFFSPVTTFAATSTTPVYVTAQNGLNIRAKATKDSKKISTVSYGTKLNMIEPARTNKNWSKVKYKGKTRYVHNSYISKKKPKKIKMQQATYKAKYSPAGFRRSGVIYYNGYRWTWYSQRVLPGGGLKIPGRHVDSNGYVCDGSGYICIASGRLSKGTVISTPLGKNAKVYDYCETGGTIDVYVNW